MNTKEVQVNSNPPKGSKEFKVTVVLPTYEELCAKIGAEQVLWLAQDNLMKHKLQPALRAAAQGKVGEGSAEAQKKRAEKNTELVAQMEAGKAFSLLDYATKGGKAKRLVSKEVMAMLGKISGDSDRLDAALAILGIERKAFDAQLELDTAGEEEEGAE